MIDRAISFDLASPAAIRNELYFHGCALLRGFADPGKLGPLIADVERLGYDRSSLVYHRQMIEAGLPAFHEYFFTPKHYALMASLGGSTVTDSTVARSMQPREGGGWSSKFFPHIDGFFRCANSVVNFWVALDPCGLDAPSLAVIPVPPDEVAEFVGANVAERCDPAERYGTFRPGMAEMAEQGLGDAMAEYQLRFAPKLWAPTYQAGDCMLFTTWTLHQTHVTPAMVMGRRNLELRFDTGVSFLKAIEEMEPTFGSPLLTQSYSRRLPATTW